VPDQRRDDYWVCGPIMTSEKGLVAEDIHKFILSTVDHFTKVAFQTSLQINDGANYNHKYMRACCELTSTTTDPAFYNPHTERWLVVCFDSPHQLKSTRTQAFKSRRTAKSLHFHIQFGRKVVEEYWPQVLVWLQGRFDSKKAKGPPSSAGATAVPSTTEKRSGTKAPGVTSSAKRTRPSTSAPREPPVSAAGTIPQPVSSDVPMAGSTP
jgi:hypothetical protein